MKINTRMSQLMRRLQVSLGDISPSKFVGNIQLANVDGATLLKQELERARSVSLRDFQDLTGFECFVNHVHLPFIETHESLQTCLQYAIDLGRQLAEMSQGRRFEVIMSVSNDGCVIRFHQLRPGELWLADDLEKYKEEGILAFVTAES